MAEADVDAGRPTPDEDKRRAETGRRREPEDGNFLPGPVEVKGDRRRRLLPHALRRSLRGGGRIRRQQRHLPEDRGDSRFRPRTVAVDIVVGGRDGHGNHAAGRADLSGYARVSPAAQCDPLALFRKAETNLVKAGNGRDIRLKLAYDLVGSFLRGPEHP